MLSEPGHHSATLTSEGGHQRIGHLSRRPPLKILSEPRPRVAGERWSATSHHLSEPRPRAAGRGGLPMIWNPPRVCLAGPGCSRGWVPRPWRPKAEAFPGGPRRDRIGGQRPYLCPTRSAGRRVLSPRPPGATRNGLHAAGFSAGSGTRPGIPGSSPV